MTKTCDSFNSSATMKTVNGSGFRTDRRARYARDGSSFTSTEEARAAQPFARKIRRRLTTNISRISTLEIQMALIHACHTSLTPNKHVTIAWALGGVDDSIRATGRYLKLVRDCLRRRSGTDEVAYIWVRENGPVTGEHVHILMHLPAGCAGMFRKHHRSWLKQCGARRVKGLVLTRQIRGSGADGPVSLELQKLYQANLGAVSSYLVKHCSIEVQTMFGITSRGPSVLCGKRVSISQNLGQSAISKCGQCPSFAEFSRSF